MDGHPPVVGDSSRRHEHMRSNYLPKAVKPSRSRDATSNSWCATGGVAHCPQLHPLKRHGEKLRTCPRGPQPGIWDIDRATSQYFIADVLSRYCRADSKEQDRKMPSHSQLLRDSLLRRLESPEGSH